MENKMHDALSLSLSLSCVLTQWNGNKSFWLNPTRSVAESCQQLYEFWTQHS